MAPRKPNQEQELHDLSELDMIRFATEGGVTAPVAEPVSPAEAPPDVVAAQKLATIQARMVDLRTLIASASPEDDIDAMTLEYAKLVTEVIPLKQQVNARALSDAKGQLGSLIHQAVGALSLQSLLGTPVRSVHYEWILKEGEQPILSVTLNTAPTTTRAPRTTAPRGTAAPAVEGERKPGRDLSQIFQDKATTEERAEMAALEADKTSGTITAKVYNTKAWALKNRVANR